MLGTEVMGFLGRAIFLEGSVNSSAAHSHSTGPNVIEIQLSIDRRLELISVKRRRSARRNWWTTCPTLSSDPRLSSEGC